MIFKFKYINIKENKNFNRFYLKIKLFVGVLQKNIKSYNFDLNFQKKDIKRC